MNRAVCFVGAAGHGRRGAAKGAALALAMAMSMGLMACSSPMQPWEPSRTTIQPAPQPHAVSPSSAGVQPVRPAPPTTAVAPVSPAPPHESARAGTANPASVYCLQRGGQLEFSTRSGGGEVGICVSPGGDECEEWAFLRGSCTW